MGKRREFALALEKISASAVDIDSAVPRVSALTLEKPLMRFF